MYSTFISVDTIHEKQKITPQKIKNHGCMHQSRCVMWYTVMLATYDNSPSKTIKSTLQFMKYILGFSLHMHWAYQVGAVVAKYLHTHESAL